MCASQPTERGKNCRCSPINLEDLIISCYKAIAGQRNQKDCCGSCINLEELFPFINALLPSGIRTFVAVCV